MYTLDRHLFNRAGLIDKYEEIGNLNLFMVSKVLDKTIQRSLPDGFRFDKANENDLNKWMHTAVDSRYIDIVQQYFSAVYDKNREEFFERVFFVSDSHNMPVATCLLWRAYRLIETLGWFRVIPECEGMGIGRFLLGEVLEKSSFPVYLHTQPTSVCAIKLYSDFGFELITDPVIGYRRNDLIEGLLYLKKVMKKEDFMKLRFTGAPELHNAALYKVEAEF